MHCFQGGSCPDHWQDASPLASGPVGRGIACGFI